MAVVLLVEDDFEVARLVQLTLDEVDARVVHAPDGPRALEMARAEEIDLILLDARLPIMSGEEVAFALREAGVEAPILVISASADLPSIAARVGATGYVRKPFDLDDLVDSVRAALDRTRPNAPS
jgi:DNA-binding response OmpR family regulator